MERGPEDPGDRVVPLEGGVTATYSRRPPQSWKDVELLAVKFSVHLYEQLEQRSPPDRLERLAARLQEATSHLDQGSSRTTGRVILAQSHMPGATRSAAEAIGWRPWKPTWPVTRSSRKSSACARRMARRLATSPSAARKSATCSWQTTAGRCPCSVTRGRSSSPAAGPERLPRHEPSLPAGPGRDSSSYRRGTRPGGQAGRSEWSLFGRLCGQPRNTRAATSCWRTSPCAIAAPARCS